MGRPLGYTTAIADDPVVHQLKARRVQMKLTQADVAERVGTKQSTVSGWERGIVEPSHRSVQRWAKAVEMRIVAVPIQQVSPTGRLTQRGPRLQNVLPPRGGSGGTPSANGSV